MFNPVIPYGPLYRQLDGMYRSGGYVKTIGSTTDTLGSLVGRAQAKLVKKRGGKMRRGGKMKC